MKADLDKLELRDDQSYWLEGSPFTGIAVSRRSDGTIESEVSFADGVQSGLVKDRYPNGQVAFEGAIKNGVYQGECKTWQRDGKLSKIETYECGICTCKKEYGPTGELVTEFKITPAHENYTLLELYRKQNDQS